METEVDLSAFIAGYPGQLYIGYVVHEHEKPFLLGGMGLLL